MAQEKSAPVIVYAESSATSFKFTHESSHLVNDKVTFYSPTGDHYIMTFVLIPGDTKLRFVKEKDNAFWSKESECPRTKMIEGPFKPISVSNNQMVLKVKNENPSIKQYYYSLQFEDEHGKVVSWDPIVDNQNGGVIHHHIALAVAFILATAAAIGAIVMAID
jgi:hypothetical protein